MSTYSKECLLPDYGSITNNEQTEKYDCVNTQWNREHWKIFGTRYDITMFVTFIMCYELGTTFAVLEEGSRKDLLRGARKFNE